MRDVAAEIGVDNPMHYVTVSALRGKAACVRPFQWTVRGVAQPG